MTNDEIKSTLINQSNTRKELKDLPQAYVGGTNYNLTKTVNNVDYGAKASDIYDIDRNGRYRAKYDFYTSGIGEENRHAQNQGTLEKIGNGLAKFGAKVGTYAAESLGTMTYGVYSAIKDGDIRSLFDNDLTAVLDDANKALDRNFAHYYSDEEKAKGVLGKMGTLNFWTNDFLGGLAFIGGAVLPNVVLAPLTGGASALGLAGSVGRLGANVASKTASLAGRKAGMATLRKGMQRGLALESGLSGVGKTARFIAQSAGFEAGMEARHFIHDSTAEYVEQFKIDNGRLPNAQEMQGFLEDVDKASRGVFGANLALLSVTNLAMFGKAFGLSSDMLGTTASGSINRFGNRLLGLTTEIAEDGTKVVKNISKGRSLANNAYYLGRKPFSEGVVEEGLQGTFTKTASNYLDSKYDDKADFSLMNAFGDAMLEQYGTSDGWSEMVVGMLVGATGKNVSSAIMRPLGDKSASFGIEGIGSSGFGAIKKEFANSVEASNKAVESFRAMQRVNSIVNMKDGQTAPAFQETVASYNFIKANNKFKNFTDIKDDYNFAVDGMELDDQMLNELEINGLSVDEYKNQLKTNFEQDFKNFNKANKLVDRIGVDNLSITEGNKQEVRDALVMQSMLGGVNDNNANKVAKEIVGMVGENSQLAIQYMDEVVSPKLKEAKDNFAKLTEQREVILDAIVKTQSDISSSTKEERVELSKKYVAQTEQLKRIDAQREAIEQYANNEIKNLGGKFGEISKNNATLPQILEAEKALNDFMNVMDKTGGNSQSLRNKLNQYKAYASIANEYDSMTQRMLSTNFFKSDEGKHLLGALTGKEYKTSKEFEQFIRDNEQEIANTYGDYGVTPSNITEAIKENPKLSDREKFQLESLLRATIISKKIGQIAEDLSQEISSEVGAPITEIESVTEITPTSPNIKGDTITNVTVSDIIAETPEKTLENAINEIERQVSEISSLEISNTLQESRDKKDELRKLNEALQNVEAGNINQQQLNELGIDYGTNEVTSSTQVDAREQARNGEEMGEGNTQGQEASQQSQEETVEDVLENALLYELNSEFGNESYAEELARELEGLSQEEVQNTLEDVLNEVENETSETEINEGDFEALAQIARQQAEGENIATTENLQLMMLYPETFEQYLQQENERITQSTEELRDGTTIGANQSTTEIETEESSELTSNEVRRNEELRQIANRIRERINTTQSEIDKIEEPFQFTKTKAYKRYVQLRSKDSLNEDELAEFNGLSNEMNAWTYFEGTVAGGVKLTDLIDQLLHLRTLTVEATVDTQEVTSEEVVQAIKSVDTQNNSDIAHNFTNVFTVRKIDGSMEVSGISPEGFRNIVGDELFEQVTLDEDKGTIIVTQEVLDLINTNTNLRLLDVEEGARSYYTPARLEVDGKLEPIQSDFETVIVLNQEAIYDIKDGDTLGMKVDVQDEYNRNLLNKAVSEMGLVQQLTEEQKVEEINRRTQLEVSKNENIKKAQASLLEVQNKTKKTAADNKKIETLRNKISKLQASVKDKVSKALEKEQSKKEGKLKESTRKELRDRLRIDLTHNGTPVNFLKAIREGNDNLMKSQLTSMRAEVVSDVDAIVKAYFTNTPIETNVKVKALKVFVGQPNFNMSEVDGVLMKNYVTFNEDNVQDIADIGYIENGELKTKSGRDVNEVMFVESTRKASKNSRGKIPFVVIEKGEKRIAYPVRVSRQEAPITETQIQDILNSEEFSAVEKAMKINTMMAKIGVDVKRSENAVVSYGEGMLNENVVQNLLQQLRGMEFLTSIDNWTDPNISIADNLVGNASIDLDTRNPFLSPKIKIDLSPFAVDGGVIQEETEIEETVKGVIPLNAIANRVSKINNCI